MQHTWPHTPQSGVAAAHETLLVSEGLMPGVVWAHPGLHAANSKALVIRFVPGVASGPQLSFDKVPDDAHHSECAKARTPRYQSTLGVFTVAHQLVLQHK